MSMTSFNTTEDFWLKVQAQAVREASCLGLLMLGVAPEVRDTIFLLHHMLRAFEQT